jgi:hypothetical protein
MNIWTHVTDLASQALVDLVRYSNGELSTDAITNGDVRARLGELPRSSERRSVPTIRKPKSMRGSPRPTATDPALFAR